MKEGERKEKWRGWGGGEQRRTCEVRGEKEWWRGEGCRRGDGECVYREDDTQF